MLGVSARPGRGQGGRARSCAGLARAGVTPDMVTIVGTLGAVAGAVVLFGTGHLFWGTVAVTCLVLLDLLDGALARARGGGSVFGAVLDSDRRPGRRRGDLRRAGLVVLRRAATTGCWCCSPCSAWCSASSPPTSRRGPRASGLSCDVGIVERIERLILVLFGTGLAGLGRAVRAARRALGAARRQRGHRRSSGSSPSAGPRAGAAAPPVPPAAP